MSEYTLKIIIQILALWLLIPTCLPAQQSADDMAATNDRKAQEYIQQGNKAEAARLYNQTAYQYRLDGNLVKAIEYYEKVLIINKELGNTMGEILSHTNLSMLYIETEQYEKALEHLEVELKYRQLQKKPTAVIPVHISIAGVKNELKQFEDASAQAQLAIDQSLEANDLTLLKRAYGMMFDIYTKWGKQELAHSYFEQYSAIDKKLKEIRMHKIQDEAKAQVSEATLEKEKTQEALKITSKELKATTVSLEEAERIARQQQMELDLQQALINEQQTLLRLEKLRKTYFATAFAITLIFVVILIFLIIRIQNAKKKINSQRKRLEVQNREIRASIRYAKTIQNALLPDLSKFEMLINPFVIYRPKDIVSGDFYWLKSISGTRIYFAVVDCTGHGVPGAFMSMIGMRMLNEIINELKVVSPSSILEKLNERLRDALRQEQTDNNDGMDLAIVRIDKISEEQYEIIYAGAKRPLYIGRKNKQLLEIFTPERKSIGGYQPNKRRIKFSNKKIVAASGDTIYMFTDGFTDQNNPARKKFGRSRLQNTLTPIIGDNAETQCRLITEHLDEFAQGTEQRDDITLSGLILR